MLCYTECTCDEDDREVVWWSADQLQLSGKRIWEFNQAHFGSCVCTAALFLLCVCVCVFCWWAALVHHFNNCSFSFCIQRSVIDTSRTCIFWPSFLSSLVSSACMNWLHACNRGFCRILLAVLIPAKEQESICIQKSQVSCQEATSSLWGQGVYCSEARRWHFWPVLLFVLHLGGCHQILNMKNPYIKAAGLVGLWA